MACVLNMKLFQMDVKTAFLNGYLKEEVYVAQPKGFEYYKIDQFVKVMEHEFEMSMIGELTFFLGLQIKQCDDGIFISQSNYVKNMLKKFDMSDCKSAKTPSPTHEKISKDNVGQSVTTSHYRGIVMRC
jgi:hypothetical protein